MRASAKRPWIKLHIIPCLEGSIRYQLDPAERGVWYDLLLLAGIQPEPGVIADSDGRPYPHSFIANRLNIDVELLKRTLKTCMDEGRITEDEHGIHITNWTAYQSEYQRQQPYREAKRQGKKEDKICDVCGWKGWGNLYNCPDCENRGEKNKLRKDYGEQTHRDLIRH